MHADIQKTLVNKLQFSTSQLTKKFFIFLSIVILTFLGYSKYSYTTTGSSYEKEISYLRNTGQTLIYDQDVEKLEKVQVTEITDGDTIKVRREDNSEVKIRYIGIDTPEIAHRNNEISENFGEEATELNSFLVEKKQVYIKSDVTDKDIYGRLLRYVYLENGEMVNYLIIRLGYAQTLTIPPNVLFEQEFTQAQEKAREDGFNLWSDY